jgi:hypothetical protein
MRFQAALLLSQPYFWEERGVFSVKFMQEVEAFNVAS